MSAARTVQFSTVTPPPFEDLNDCPPAVYYYVFLYISVFHMQFSIHTLSGALVALCVFACVCFL